MAPQTNQHGPTPIPTPDPNEPLPFALQQPCRRRQPAIAGVDEDSSLRIANQPVRDGLPSLVDSASKTTSACWSPATHQRLGIPL